MTTVLERSPAAARPSRSTAHPSPPPRLARGLLLRRAGATAARGIAVPVLLITSFLTFCLGALSDQKPAEIKLGEAATAADVARIEHELGLDRPLLVQYVAWLGHALQGDLGTSWFTGIPVSTSIAERFPVSLSVALAALVLAILGGSVLGTVAALRRGSLLDRGITVVSTVISTLPPFVVAIVLIVVFGVLFPVLPTGGYFDPADGVGPWLLGLVLPAVALSLDGAAELARQLRTGLVGALGENYVLGARLRGYSPTRVLLVHVLRNAVGPAVSALGLQIPRLIGGAIIAEAIFAIPGLGLLARDAAMRGDVPVVIGSLLVSVVMVLIASLVVNIVLTVLRPGPRRAEA
jgi:peptide/nickel transport system permease protein